MLVDLSPRVPTAKTCSSTFVVQLLHLHAYCDLDDKVCLPKGRLGVSVLGQGESPRFEFRCTH